MSRRVLIVPPSPLVPSRAPTVSWNNAPWPNLGPGPGSRVGRRAMTIRIVIDRERCVGSGNCLYWAPGTFDLDDDGISVVVDPAGDNEDRIRVAAEGCPTRAISVEYHDGPDRGPDRAPEGDRPEDQRGPHADRTD